jgi:hypothetical protein
LIPVRINPTLITFVVKLYALYAPKNNDLRPGGIDIQNIDCFLGSFCYIRTVFRLNCLTAQPSYEGGAAVEGGK